MQLLISGSHGLVGRDIVGRFTAQGHRVVRLVRSRPSPSGDEVMWDPAAATIDEGSDLPCANAPSAMVNPYKNVRLLDAEAVW